MHMQSLGKELPYSIPLEVYFAGFRSNTLALAKAGWDLSMQQELSHRDYKYLLRLAMRHTGANLYAISAPNMIEPYALAEVQAGRFQLRDFLAGMPFQVGCVAPDIRFKIYPEIGVSGSLSDSFQPIDPFPQERFGEESIQDFKFFKVSNPTIQDIIIAPEQVSEVLDKILKVQAPIQKELRSRERSRHNLKDMREMNVKPAHQVQAQLITLCG